MTSVKTTRQQSMTRTMQPCSKGSLEASNKAEQRKEKKENVPPGTHSRPAPPGRPGAAALPPRAVALPGRARRPAACGPTQAPSPRCRRPGRCRVAAHLPPLFGRRLQPPAAPRRAAASCALLVGGGGGLLDHRCAQ
eukprot:358846-Chlamydomonas_euryale.AAC.1